MVFVWFGVAVLAMLGSINQVYGRHMNHLMKECKCICRPIDGVWPWVDEDLKVLMKPGEIRHNVFGHGDVVCLRSDELDPNARIEEIQRGVYEGEDIRTRAERGY